MYFQGSNRDTDIGNGHMDPVVGKGWEELGN